MERLQARTHDEGIALVPEAAPPIVEYGSTREMQGVSEPVLSEITAVMDALDRLKDAELELEQASRSAMGLNAQEMRALQYIVAGRGGGEVVTPGDLAARMGISAASTTKLLNRLERGGHVMRLMHPRDRRAFSLEVAPATEARLQRARSRQQARRFYAAAHMDSEERRAITRFLEQVTLDIMSDGESWAAPEASVEPLEEDVRSVS